MSLGDLLVALAVLALLLTKLADVLTTLGRINGSDHSLESNPLVRPAMGRLGIAPAAWLVFGLSSTIVLAVASAFWGRGPSRALAFVSVALPLAFVQGAVALANAKGRPNWVSRLVLSCYVQASSWLRNSALARSRKQGPR